MTKTMYDTDSVEWTAHTAELLREGRLHDADLDGSGVVFLLSRSPLTVDVLAPHGQSGRFLALH